MAYTLAQRQAEIAKVVAQVDRKRTLLAQRLLAGEFDLQQARDRNAGMPGVLGQRWAEFLDLPASEQAATLREPRFRGMAWQSLLQCSPFLMSRA
jgi:hypothetical protein